MHGRTQGTKFLNFEHLGIFLKKGMRGMNGNWSVSEKQAIYISAFVLMFACLLAYIILRDGTDVSNIRNSIQRIEDDNRQTREQIGAAAEQIESASKGVDGAETGIDRSLEAITRVEESISRNESELDECQRIVSEGRSDIARARKILDDIRAADEGTGA